MELECLGGVSVTVSECNLHVSSFEEQRKINEACPVVPYPLVIVREGAYMIPVVNLGEQ